MNNRHYLPFLLVLISLSAFGQADFRTLYEGENPVPPDSDLPHDERISLHRAYTTAAIDNQDTLREIVGEIYVFHDHINRGDYTSATANLLRAESLVKAAAPASWQGWVAYRRGTLNMKLRQTEKAIVAYKEAAEKCKMAADSLCLAESLEQIGTCYALQKDYPPAQRYFDLALPMIERHGQKRQLAKSFSNYGGFLNQQRRHQEAVPYLEKSVALFAEIGDELVWAKAKNNLAMVKSRTGQVDEALRMFYECIDFNKDRGFVHNIMRNYSGIKESYRVLGDYESAYAYFRKYVNLRDSLMGSETQLEIAEIEAKYNAAQQELVLEKSQNALRASQQKYERIGVFVFFLLAAGLIAAWLWWRQTHRARIRRKESKKNLDVVTRLLAQKNEALLKAEGIIEQSKSNSDDDPAGAAEQPINVFDRSILTSTDWSDFKAYFEDSYPGYIQRLRARFSGITEAEERLFLLLKLNLTSKEISNILGISTSSVKKTRNRLRKRLALMPEVNLDDFVKRFGNRERQTA